MLLSAFSVLLAAASAQPAVPTDREQSEQELVVTGKKVDPREKLAEEPYETTPRIMLGSRIARKPGGRRVFNTVATDTGLAGLLAGNDSSIDATGGSAAAFVKRHVKSCRAKQQKLNEETACALLEARKKMDRGEFAAASAVLAPLLASRIGWNRYHAGQYAYLLAERSGDEPGRERALTVMLQSGRMADADRTAAQKTLVAMALRRGDHPSAIAWLEAIVQAVPNDDRSLANLAALYAGRGEHDRARPLMLSAVAAARARGEAPMSSWTEYLATPAGN